MRERKFAMSVKGTACFPCRNDGIADAHTEILDGVQSESDVAVIDNGEVAVAFIHRRRQDRDTHALALRDDLRDPFHVA